MRMSNRWSPPTPSWYRLRQPTDKPAEGSSILTRDQYVKIRQEKPKNKYQQDAPKYRTCRHLTEAIITDGTAKDVTTAGCIGFGGRPAPDTT
jgi:hypothetical protein